MPSDQSSITEYVARSTGLPPGRAARLVSDVTAAFTETVERYVVRRHRELQLEGRANDAIFVIIAAELETWRFRAPTLTTRQLRRIVYG
jgi:hypothetical protein